MEVLAAEIVLFLLFRAGGGFGPASLERPWVLNLYNLLSVAILGKVRMGRGAPCAHSVGAVRACRLRSCACLHSASFTSMIARMSRHCPGQSCGMHTRHDAQACRPTRHIFQAGRVATPAAALHPLQCTTDCYVYQLAPAMWRHFRPGQPWGVPTILALRLSPVLGIQAQTIQSTLRVRGAAGRCPVQARQALASLRGNPGEGRATRLACCSWVASPVQPSHAPLACRPLL